MAMIALYTSKFEALCFVVGSLPYDCEIVEGDENPQTYHI